MRPEDFTIEFSHQEDTDRGCECDLTISCPAGDGWEAPINTYPNETLGAALDKAREHIAEKHAGLANPSAYPDTPGLNADNLTS